MKHIIILTRRFPYPTFGGDQLRLARILEVLDSVADVTLIVLDGIESSASLPSSLSRTTVLWMPVTGKEKVVNSVMAFFMGRSLQSRLFFKRNAFEFLRSSYQRDTVILCHLFRTACNVPADIPFVCEFTDAISLNYETFRKIAVTSPLSLVTKVLLWYEGLVLSRDEGSVLRRCRGAVVVSERDRAALSRNERIGSKCLKRIFVLPNGHDKPIRNRVNRSPSENSHRILTIGNYASAQNRDGVEFFLKYFWRDLKVFFPGLGLVVAGNVPAKFRKRLERYPDVSVVGRFDDLASIGSEFIAGLCPVRFGAGQQNKILDYFSLGIPVISTRVGRDGFLGAGLPIHCYDSFSELRSLVESAVAGNLTSIDGKTEFPSWEGALSQYVEVLRSCLN